VNASLAAAIARQHWYNIWPPNKANAAERIEPRPLTIPSASKLASGLAPDPQRKKCQNFDNEKEWIVLRDSS